MVFACGVGEGFGTASKNEPPVPKDGAVVMFGLGDDRLAKSEKADCLDWDWVFDDDMFNELKASRPPKPDCDGCGAVDDAKEPNWLVAGGLWGCGVGFDAEE